MNRRTFLQSVSAAFAAIAVGARSPAQSLPAIDYTLFTEHNSLHLPRFDLSRPFTLHDHVYATDARVLLTHPGSYRRGSEALRVPDLSKLWWDEFDGRGWKSLGDPVRTKGYGGCPRCHGSGSLATDCCGLCGGDGRVYTRFGEALERCPRCGCPECDGSGEVFYREQIGSAVFCPDYTARLRTLGEIDVRTIVVPSQPTFCFYIGTLLLFRGDRGVRGFLAELRRD